MKDESRSPKATKLSWYERLSIAALQFAILFAFWLILSGHYEVKYISLGVLAAGGVTFLTNDLFCSLFHRGENEKTNALFPFLVLGRFLIYLPWLLYKIVLANIQVAYLVLHPRMPIDPSLLQFRTQMRRNASQVILANSITLTPGTVTVNLEDGEYIIHILKPSLTELQTAEPQNKVGAIFKENKEKPPTVLWAYSIEELKQ